MGFMWNYACNFGAVAAGRRPRRPLLFSYYVTHRCALNCGYCSDGNGRSFKESAVPELDGEAARRLIAILARSASTLDITGGEPLMRTDLEELLEHARRAGMRVILNTKAHGVRDRPRLLELADVIVISVDALDVDRLAELQGTSRDVAGRTLEALAFLAAEAPGRGTKVVLSAVASPRNLGDVAEVLRYAARRGFGFHLSPQIVGTRPHEALRSNPAYVALINEAAAAKRKGTVLGVSGYLTGIRDFRPYDCYPALMPTIRPDGRLYYPCLESGRAEVSVLEEGDYRKALAKAEAAAGGGMTCGTDCQIFCHMGLSLFQRHPGAALKEGRIWRAIGRPRRRAPTAAESDGADARRRGGMR